MRHFFICMRRKFVAYLMILLMDYSQHRVIRVSFNLLTKIYFHYILNYEEKVITEIEFCF